MNLPNNYKLRVNTENMWVGVENTLTKKKIFTRDIPLKTSLANWSTNGFVSESPGYSLFLPDGYKVRYNNSNDWIGLEHNGKQIGIRVDVPKKTEIIEKEFHTNGFYWENGGYSLQLPNGYKVRYNTVNGWVGVERWGKQIGDRIDT